MYQMKSTDISMIIIIESQGTTKLHSTNCVNCFFYNIDFQRSKGGFKFCEKLNK